MLFWESSTRRRLIEWVRVVFPVQVALALTYAATRRALLLLPPLRLRLPSLQARLGRPSVQPVNVRLATTPRSLTFAFAVANVFITHGYAGAAVVLTPVTGFFLALQLARAGRASSWRARRPPTEPREKEGCASRGSQADCREVRQRRDKTVVWFACVSTLVACNLFEPPTRMSVGSRRPTLANGLLGLTSFNHWKALRYTVRTEDARRSRLQQYFYGSLLRSPHYFCQRLAEPTFTFKKKEKEKKVLSTGSATMGYKYYSYSAS